MCKSMRILLVLLLGWAAFNAEAQKPNILFILADDMSYPYLGVYGNRNVSTPNIDRIAKQGMTFTQAYCSSPSCTPSRASILTGKYPHTLGEGVNLTGRLMSNIPTYVKLLLAEGYDVAFDRKGWGPGDFTKGGYAENPAGRQQVFDKFLKEVPDEKPFFFWFGSNDPHRMFPFARGRMSGIDPDKIKVPAFLPDVAEVRSDIADYFFEINRFDRDIGDLLKQLEASGRLANTIIVVASDNGMPFPHAKANLYDYGTRIPLIIADFGSRIPKNTRHDSFVNLIDLTPTFLDLAGVRNQPVMHGKSLMPVLSGASKEHRQEVFLERERHCLAREAMNKQAGYPMRAIRTRDYLYIQNMRPNRMPGGDAAIAGTPSVYGDVDGGPTKAFIVDNRLDPMVKPFFELGFGLRPAEELYVIKDDPYNIHNKIGDPALAQVREQLRSRLEQWMKETNDPRSGGGGDVLDEYPSTTRAWITMWGIVFVDEK